VRRLAPVLAVLSAAACVAPASNRAASPVEVTEPSAPATSPAPLLPPAGPATFVYNGEITQGGWIRGQVPAGTTAAWLDSTPLAVDRTGHFFAAFDRDAMTDATLRAELGDRSTITIPLVVSARAWDISRVDIPRLPGGETPEAYWKTREPEVARITAARAVETGSDGWRQAFVWPAKGRISTLFGSQRIYRGGEAGSYHSGIDIAPGAGVVYVAPADGVVTLAADTPFSLEGYLLIIDHGQGLNSAFLHSSALLVHEGDTVRQGQPLGRVGMTGRASGPHLHWSLTWRGRRLDPLLFTGPMG